ncbi:zinc finger BED domain-containing protein 4-like [Neoarius graeffei]|uniref:zinc finger BED domain-containing protein 4-like n=1 Tax=Neoarius graeffei TaxID=443677 RepID=UPI00298D3148|nr:zinc finger BED domain-containing protein 4-like [Neoarius graeffei]
MTQRGLRAEFAKKTFAFHSSTTNMLYHLNHAHPLYCDEPASSTASSSSSLTEQKLVMKPSLSEKRKRDITDKIADFIALDMRPVNIISGEGFKNLIEYLEPGYSLPRCDTVMHAVTSKYNSTKQTLQGKIENCKAVSFTTDIWTSNQMESYMTVTAHFISDNWRLHSFVLETKVLEVSHTAANIAERLSEVMADFRIPAEKRVALVHDNAANMVLCADQLSQNPSWGNVQGVRCAGHTLQLCINVALKKDPICRVIAAARRLVGHFKKSAKATAALTQKQQNVVEHKLIQDVSTRWNSTHCMLERLLEQRWPVTAVLSNPVTTHRSDCDLDLTTAQWRIAEDIVSVLKPMVTLTELLSQDVNASLSATLPMLINMKRRHLLLREDDGAAVTALKKTLREEIDKRWELKEELQSSIYIKAAVLDPRFKNLSFMEEEKRD